jgi:hypothetical protein
VIEAAAVAAVAGDPAAREHVLDKRFRPAGGPPLAGAALA